MEKLIEDMFATDMKKGVKVFEKQLTVCCCLGSCKWSVSNTPLDSHVLMAVEYWSMMSPRERMSCRNSLRCYRGSDRCADFGAFDTLSEDPSKASDEETMFYADFLEASTTPLGGEASACDDSECVGVEAICCGHVRGTAINGTVSIEVCS